MTAPRTAFVPAQRPPADPLDGHVRRMGGERAVAAVAAAPVRHLPAALLDALQDSWGTAEELGLRGRGRTRAGACRDDASLPAQEGTTGSR